MLGQHRHGSGTPFKWRFDGGLITVRLKWYLDTLFPHDKKRSRSWTPLTKLSGSEHARKQ